MKKQNPPRYSSAVGEIWVMATFKVKYCRKIFDDPLIRRLCEILFKKAFEKYGIECRKIAFDADHVHIILELGLYKKQEIAKNLKGYVARKLFKNMPWVKKKFFWGSGLWNPAYDIRSVNDMGVYIRYLDKQKYATKGQVSLLSFS